MIFQIFLNFIENLGGRMDEKQQNTATIRKKSVEKFGMQFQ